MCHPAPDESRPAFFLPGRQESAPRASRESNVRIRRDGAGRGSRSAQTPRPVEIRRLSVYPDIVLLLKKHLVDLVREGKKRQTLRFWTRPIVSEGQVSYTPGLGKMLIKRIDLIRDISELTQTDAQADGFRDLPELLAELHRIYPVIPPAGKKLYRIIFEWPVPDSHAKLRKSTGSRRRSGNEKSRRAQRDKPTAMKGANSTEISRKPTGEATVKQPGKEVESVKHSALQRSPTRAEMLQLRDWILIHAKG